MTVKELILLLKKMPLGATVVVQHDDIEWDTLSIAESVYFIKGWRDHNSVEREIYQYARDKHRGEDPQSFVVIE